MKGKLLILGLALCVVTLLAGCDLSRGVSIAGSGIIVTREENITGFDRIDANHAFQVEVRQGETYGVVIRIDDNLEKHLEVVKKGSTLHISFETNRAYFVRNVTLQAEITMPALAGLNLSGASSATITGFTSTKALDIDLSGASSLRGDIKAGNAGFDVSGASRVTLTGSAGDATIEAEGASAVDLSAFAVVDANVDASGASRVTVNPSGRLDVEASGASDVYYLGSPTLGRMETSGASDIHRK